LDALGSGAAVDRQALDVADQAARAHVRALVQ
jgi:hypothetical protein